MNKIKRLFLSLILLAGLGLQAQQKNILWDREFWNAKPDLETVKAKVAEGHSPSALTPFGFDAVTGALFSESDNDIVKYLLEQKGNEVNKLTHDGRNYMFWAAYKNNLEIMKYLLAKGSRTDIIDDKGNSLLIFTAATGQKNREIYDFIIRQGANIQKEKSKDGANALLLLIPHLTDFSMVDYFIGKGLDIHSTDKYGNGAFNYTARTGNIEMLKKLVDKGVDYKTLNKNGGNAFIFASEGARGVVNGMEVYQYLQSLGLDPNITTKDGVNPLHNIAYDVKDTQVFEFFLNKGVDFNQINNEGNTPFIHAAAYNSKDIIEYLFPKVKELDHSNKKGETALTRAISRNKAQVVAFLLANGANAQVKDKKGNNLAYYLINAYAVEKADDFYAKASLLEKNKVDFTTHQASDNTLLHIAIEKQDLKLLEYLGKFKIDINATNSAGLSALHLAAMKAKDDTILKFLLKQGADKSATTDFDETPYDMARENEMLQINKVNVDFLK
jgi:ankyrin repeat protein